MSYCAIDFYIIPQKLIQPTTNSITILSNTRHGVSYYSHATLKIAYTLSLTIH